MKCYPIDVWGGVVVVLWWSQAQTLSTILVHNFLLSLHNRKALQYFRKKLASLSFYSKNRKVKIYTSWGNLSVNYLIC